MVIGRFEIELTFDGSVSGYTVAQLQTLAAAIKAAIDADNDVQNALSIAGGDFAVPRVWYNPGVSAPSNVGGVPGTIVAS